MEYSSSNGTALPALALAVMYRIIVHAEFWSQMTDTCGLTACAAREKTREYAR
jgi:hypothetical protein